MCLTSNEESAKIIQQVFYPKVWFRFCWKQLSQLKKQQQQKAKTKQKEWLLKTFLPHPKKTFDFSAINIHSQTSIKGTPSIKRTAVQIPVFVPHINFKKVNLTFMVTSIVRNLYQTDTKKNNEWSFWPGFSRSVI